MDFKSITNKVMLFILFIATTQSDAIMGTNSKIRITKIFFFIGNELLSL
ncbi:MULTISPECIES: phage holin family protein [Bacillus]|nr:MULTISPECIES: phage holin family protein [Bacillus]MCU0096312.1 phage holin family protein [Bacillus sp. OR9]MCU4758495.1 phage holin family protein [Bacillus cereus]MCU5107267.1 phage holin family protein [Bacillus cereus]MCU5337841.1 phage holin family protein [Bacillus cereus]MDF2019845.1 phage holin family protein [Bacillus sp. Cr_R3]